jgi:hypothetical protein
MIISPIFNIGRYPFFYNNFSTPPFPVLPYPPSPLPCITQLTTLTGIIGVVNIDKGIFKVEGQLAPTSYILDPQCKLTGGFALAYWFSPSPYAGDWVFAAGGYHPAYVKPAHYPAVSSPVGITWQYSDEIRIQGGAYLAVTPQCLMGGGRLQATVSRRNLFKTKSSLDLNFQAWADFLINYQPFRYMGDVGARIFAKVRADMWFISGTFALDTTATLHAEGPPFRGTLTVRGVPVLGEVTVEFGAPLDPAPPLDWPEFVEVVLQRQLGVGEVPVGHTISLAEGNMMDDGAGTGVQGQGQGQGQGQQQTSTAKARNANDPIVVRTGPVTINVQSRFPIAAYSLTTVDGPQTGVGGNDPKDVFFKPMQTPKKVGSVVAVTVTPIGKPNERKELVFGAPTSNVPSGIWGPCKCHLLYTASSCSYLVSAVCRSNCMMRLSNYPFASLSDHSFYYWLVFTCLYLCSPIMSSSSICFSAYLLLVLCICLLRSAHLSIWKKS